MNTVERIFLHLRRPTKDALFKLDPSINASALMLSSELDESTGLTYGARDRDWLISNETARALIAIFRSEAPYDFAAGAAIVQAIRVENAAIVGALIVSLGLNRHILHVSTDDAFDVAWGLTKALQHLPRTSTDDELNEIKDWATMQKGRVPTSPDPYLMQQYKMQHHELEMLIRTVEDVQRFRDRGILLQGDSPVIDRDRRQLADRLEKLLVAPEVRALLDAADRDAASGDFKGAMEKCRTFLERTYEACCRRHVPPDGTVALPEDNAGGSIGPWLKWATKAHLLKQKEHDVVQALSSFLAMEGSHSPQSEARQFAVGKACVIEWCLLVADRVQTP